MQIQSRLHALTTPLNIIVLCGIAFTLVQRDRELAAAVERRILDVEYHYEDLQSSLNTISRELFNVNQAIELLDAMHGNSPNGGWTSSLPMLQPVSSTLQQLHLQTESSLQQTVRSIDPDLATALAETHPAGRR